MRRIERTANTLTLPFEEDTDERAILQQMVSRHRHIGSPLNYIGGERKAVIANLAFISETRFYLCRLVLRWLQRWIKCGSRASYLQ